MTTVNGNFMKLLKSPYKQCSEQTVRTNDEILI